MLLVQQKKKQYMIALRGDYLSFLSQCLFYYINSVINFLNNEYLSIQITNNGILSLAIISILLMVVGFVVIFKLSKKPIRYLDIPLIFLATTMTLVFKIYVSHTNWLSLLPGVLALIPSAFHIVRCIQWFIDVKKKRRIPQKKNIIIVIAYIVATLLMCSLLFVDFSVKKQNPTSEEIKLVNECYDYTEKYLTNLPNDKAILQEIERITAEVIENDVFVRSYDESEFYKDGNGGIFRNVEKLKNINRKIAYAGVVALRLKTLIALKDYENYNEFFTDNCGYLFYAGLSYYFDLWVNDDYKLTQEDFKTIISGYESAYKLCDNDSDRLFINGDIITFYNEYAPEDTGIEKYEQIRGEIYDSNDFDDLLNDARNNVGYTSEKLAIE